MRIVYRLYKIQILTLYRNDYVPHLFYSIHAFSKQATPLYTQLHFSHLFFKRLNAQIHARARAHSHVVPKNRRKIRNPNR